MKSVISALLSTAGILYNIAISFKMFLNNYHNILLSCTLALLYQCILHYLFGFILLMQLVNGAQFLNITFLLVLFAAGAPTAVLLTVIFSLTCISTIINKLDLNTDALNLICLLGEYVPLASSFISTQFLL